MSRQIVPTTQLVLTIAKAPITTTANIYEIIHTQALRLITIATRISSSIPSWSHCFFRDFPLFERPLNWAQKIHPDFTLTFKFYLKYCIIPLTFLLASGDVSSTTERWLLWSGPLFCNIPQSPTGFSHVLAAETTVQNMICHIRTHFDVTTLLSTSDLFFGRFDQVWWFFIRRPIPLTFGFVYYLPRKLCKLVKLWTAISRDYPPLFSRISHLRYARTQTSSAMLTVTGVNRLETTPNFKWSLLCFYFSVVALWWVM